MDIEWLGRACFRLKGSGVTIVTDPFDNQGKVRADVPEADVVTLSCGPRDGQEADKVRAKRRVLRSAGEFEIGGIFVTAVKTYRDAERGAARGPNTAYRLKLDGVQVCHLGAIGHVPTSDHASALGDVDVLLVPVGGETLTPAQASETVGLFEPKVVVPMPADGSAAAANKTLQAFVKELGGAAPAPVSKLSLSLSSLGEGPRVVLLEQARAR